MSPERLLSSVDATAEIGELIETLHEAGRRLEELTFGEVDTVADREGHTFVLRRAQEHLRHVESSKQAAILNALPANIALLDAQGIILSVNEAWQRFGAANALQAPGHAVGSDYLDICDRARGDDAAEAQRAAIGVRSVLEGESRSFSLEYACHSPTAQRWFLMTVTPLNESQGSGAVIMHLEVTARRQSEESLHIAGERLRTSEAQYRMLFESNPHPMWVYDLETLGFVAVNGAAVEHYGYSEQQFLAMTIRDIRPGEAVATLEAQISLQEDGRNFGVWRHRKRDGSLIDVEISSDGIAFNHRPARLVMAHDVTAARHAAEQLRESQRRFSDMLDNVELISLMLDASAGITYCNDYFLRLTGWSREDVIGRNWFAIFAPIALGDLKAGFAALLDDRPDTRHRDNEILLRSGERRLIRWNNTVLRSGAGVVIGTASIGEDITERKIAEAVLGKRAAELERFHRLSVGRELQMIELKRQVNEQARLAGREPPYDLTFVSSKVVKQAAIGHEQPS